MSGVTQVRLLNERHGRHPEQHHPHHAGGGLQLCQCGGQLPGEGRPFPSCVFDPTQAQTSWLFPRFDHGAVVSSAGSAVLY